MNIFLELLQRRRSIRKFTEQKVEVEKRDQILEAGLRAPSSRGRKPWEFVVVENPELLKKLGSAKQHGSQFVASAPLAIVVAADPEKCDVWIEDIAITATLMQLAAVSLGLGSCWAQIRLREHDAAGQSASDYLVNLLGLPAGLQVGVVLGIGYSDEDKPGHQYGSLSFEQLHAESYGQRLLPGKG